MIRFFKKTMIKFKKKFLCLLLIMTFTFSGTLTVNAAPAPEEYITPIAVYNRSVGGKQIFEITEDNGKSSCITITELPSITRVSNGAYNIEYIRYNTWRAGFNINVSSNRFTSAYGQYFYPFVGSLASEYLSVDNATQATYSFVYKVSAIYTNDGVRAVISGGNINVYPL